jgi:uncharacterized protein YqhQ
MATESQTNNKKKNSSFISDFIARMGILGELLSFLWRRKLYWMIPMILTLFIFAIIIILGSSGPGGVFIYTLF